MYLTEGEIHGRFKRTAKIEGIRDGGAKQPAHARMRYRIPNDDNERQAIHKIGI